MGKVEKKPKSSKTVEDQSDSELSIDENQAQMAPPKKADKRSDLEKVINQIPEIEDIFNIVIKTVKNSSVLTKKHTDFSLKFCID